ncbi:beta-ketoacyl-ACP synthase II [SAR86 cluster bacterium]|jgi:3-oxoacyl-[acyl-carrier-protein] synthase-1|nr:beta-ketoacyl-ACP synthase II [SAR86 cluster bacterium]MEC7197744.1 beta-ketoacyl-ACP synthase II [Pseudomonadota bacterium]
MSTLKRAVITGIGAISCIGNNISEITKSLKSGTSGIRFNESYKELGMRSHISGSINLNLKDLIDRKHLRFMGEAASYAYLSAAEAIKDSGLDLSRFSSQDVGVIAGSGGASSRSQVEAADIVKSKGVKRIGPYRVTQTMGNTVSAALATFFGIKGVNFSISSACSTSAHCIGSALEQIQLGKQKIILAGGAEDEHWTMSSMFDAMGALSSSYNESPEKASRPFDKDRDGFVIAGGAGMLVVEELDHALERNADIYAEITGYGATSDGDDMVHPSGEGATNCMLKAVEMHGKDNIDYINAHGTSTPAGDPVELESIKKVFIDKIPPISSTKSQTGHTLGAAGALESIFSLLMLKNSFISKTLNLSSSIDEGEGLDLVSEVRDQDLDAVMNNSFGFGGTNVSLVFEKLKS